MTRTFYLHFPPIPDLANGGYCRHCGNEVGTDPAQRRLLVHAGTRSYRCPGLSHTEAEYETRDPEDWPYDEEEE